MIIPAIVVVGYNRPNSLKRLLSSISKANYNNLKDITLVISIDKAPNQEEVLAVANEFKWEFGEKIVRTFNEKQGLRKHVVQCGDLSTKYDAVIILEDDLVVSPNYYDYVLKALEFYKDNDIIAGIALYSHEWNGYTGRFFYPIQDEYDTYMGQFSITWGQCWTKKSWTGFKKWYNNHQEDLKYNEMIPDSINKWSKQSWGKYFVNYIVENNLYYVIPRISLTTNFSEIGQHAKKNDTDHQVRILESYNYNYQFAAFEKAKKYDIFFENKELPLYFNQEILKSGITVDLNGYGRINKNNRYLLTTLNLPYEKIKSYGLQMRPIDINIIDNIEGNDIYLYDTHINKKTKCKMNSNLIRYDIRGISNRKLIKYIRIIIKEKLIERFKKS